MRGIRLAPKRRDELVQLQSDVFTQNPAQHLGHVTNDLIEYRAGEAASPDVG
jgi:hypothetical protein